MEIYLKYLHEVLGIKNVMIPSAEGAEVNYFFSESGPIQVQEKIHAELVFLNIVTQGKESLFQPQAKELFEKMKSAMKLANIQTLAFDCLVSSRSEIPSEFKKICESKYVVLFSSFPENIGEFRIVGSGRWIETYSPAYLLEDSAAKKVVWADLQKVMKELNL